MEKAKMCKFYEADLDAMKEAEDVEALARECFGDEEMQAGAESAGECPADPCAGCWGCKHLCGGAGFPGEYVYSCRKPGNEHIISTEFDEAAVI